MTTTTPTQFTHRAVLGEDSILCSGQDWQQACDALLARRPAGSAELPTLERLAPERPNRLVVEPVLLPARAASLAPAAPAQTAELKIGEMDEEGRDRSARDYAAARAAGFALPDPIYARGSHATGMRQHRDSFEELPPVNAAMASLVSAVRGEGRVDLPVRGADLRMTEEGAIQIAGRPGSLVLDAEALVPLAARLGMTAAGAFLASIPPDERAWNINRQTTLRSGRSELLARTRYTADGTGDRKIWAITSQNYPTSADADGLALAVMRTLGETDRDARAAVTYDGRRTKIEVLQFSSAAPERAVAGEVFQVGIRVRSRDDGGSGIHISTVIFANLCLNFIIIAEQNQHEASIVHRGDPAALLQAKVEPALERARGRLGYFLDLWGTACDDNLLDAVAALAPSSEDEALVARANALLAGAVAETRARALAPLAFATLVRNRTIPAPTGAGRAAMVAGLVRAWEADGSSARRDPEALTRASLSNAVTRWAHEGQPDAWRADELERVGGSMLMNRRLF